MHHSLRYLSIICLCSSLQASLVVEQIDTTKELFSEIGKAPPSLDTIQRLLDSGVSVNAVAEEWTPLLYAAKKGQLGVCRLLLEKDADLNVCLASNGSTPLHFAILFKHETLALFLLEQKGIEPDKPDSQGATPLHYAAKSGLENICKMLIDTHGVNMLARANGNKTVLHIATRCGHNQLVRFFVGKRVPVTTATEKGRKALHYAAARASTNELIPLLIYKGALVNARTKKGETPLHYAAQQNNIDGATLLLAQGADVNAQDDEGETAFDKALFLQNEQVCFLLLKHDGISFAAPPAKKTSALHRAVHYGSYELCVALVDKVTEIDPRDECGETPLFHAVRRGEERLVSLLINKGADVAAASTNGATALHEAAKINKSVLCQLLLEHEADCNAQGRIGETPLFSAIRTVCTESALYLIAYGADVQLADSLGSTPLHQAALKGLVELVDPLLDKGALINSQDSYNKTPLDKAEGNDEMIALLKEKGAETGETVTLREADTPVLKKTGRSRASSKKQRVACEPTPSLKLYSAVLYDRPIEQCEELIKQGAPVNVQDLATGNTPLFLAAHEGKTALCELLLRNGADPFIATNEGETPLEIAARRGHKEAVICMIRFISHSDNEETVSQLDSIISTLLVHERVDAEMKQEIKKLVAPSMWATMSMGKLVGYSLLAVVGVVILYYSLSQKEDAKSE